MSEPQTVGQHLKIFRQACETSPAEAPDHLMVLVDKIARNRNNGLKDSFERTVKIMSLLEFGNVMEPIDAFPPKQKEALKEVSLTSISCFPFHKPIFRSGNCTCF